MNLNLMEIIDDKFIFIFIDNRRDELLQWNYD